ncbi:RNA polymerase sigma factor [Planctomicrobium sp. SH668]|uniref:RNA polymerase sigma factor n=1 Tax=Planctomicrobium sp. SH668 TaxID=3448126 RepID=UPI003F5B3EA6
MSIPSTIVDRELVRRIRQGDEAAWRDCIAEYEGRLQAFVQSRLSDATLAEDLVQETFIGFLTALPNYQDSTPLESFLFAIAAHKITDALRRRGRRPKFSDISDDQGGEPAGRMRMASSLARSREQRDQEQQQIATILRDLIRSWYTRGEFERMKCAELIFVVGMPNKHVASQLGISEQDVANHKQYVLSKLKAAVPVEHFERPDKLIAPLPKSDS